MDLEIFLTQVSVYAIPALFAITLHEVAHGWAARWFGDRTAELLGRLSINPLRHIDPVGTLVVPGLLLAFNCPLFGWARPVPVATAALNNPRRASILVAAAGPAANLAMAIFWCAILGVSMSVRRGATLDSWVVLMAQAGIVINIFLGLFNLLPIPPLDGGRVLAGLLPLRLGLQLEKVEPFGLFIVFALSATHLFSWMFHPAYYAIGRVMTAFWVGPA